MQSRYSIEISARTKLISPRGEQKIPQVRNVRDVAGLIRHWATKPRDVEIPVTKWRVAEEIKSAERVGVEERALGIRDMPRGATERGGTCGTAGTGAGGRGPGHDIAP